MARHTVTFAATGSLQTITLPSTFNGGFQLDVRGAQGQAGNTSGAPNGGGSGGKGGRVTGTQSPSVADLLDIYVAQRSSGYGFHTGGNAGAGTSTGAAGGKGGGSSAIVNTTSGATYAEAAGGGGGGGGAGSGSGAAGGNGGNNNGGAGQNGHGVNPGSGAPSGIGGAGGYVGGNGSNGGIGANGGNGGPGQSFGGGGGGGGGGGADSGGGGGGGASPGGGGGGGCGANNGVVPSGGSSFNGYQAGDGAVIISWLTQPTVTPTGPTGTVGTTSSPTFTATYSSADGAGQQSFRLVVYTQPVGGWPSGFDPGSGAYTGDGGVPLVPLYDSGTILNSGSTMSIQPTRFGAPIAFPNGNLGAFWQTTDTAGADTQTSPWAQQNWVQAVVGVTTPTFTVQPSPSTARNILTITAADNLLDLYQAGMGLRSTGLGPKAEWAAGDGNTTASNVSSPVQQGGNAMAMTATGSGSISLETGQGVFSVPSGLSNIGPGPVTVGQTYTALATFQAATTGRNCQVLIQWMWTDGVNWHVISTSTGATVADATSGWAEATVTGVAPAAPGGAATYAWVIAKVAGVAASEEHFIGEAGLYAFPTAPAWSTGGLPTAYFVVQRSYDGITFFDICDGFPDNTAPPGAPIVFADRGAPREVNLWYRVQQVSLNGPAGSAEAGNWATAGPFYLYSDGHDWLFSAADPTLDGPCNYQGPNIQSTSHEDQAQYYPEGRTDPVIFHGTIHNEAFISGIGSSLMTFMFNSDAEWLRWIELRALQRPCLLKTVYGDTELEQFWFTIGPDVGTTRYGGGNRGQAGNARGPQIRTVTHGVYVGNEPTGNFNATVILVGETPEVIYGS